MSMPEIPGRAVYLIPIKGLTRFDKLTKLGPSGLRLPVAPLDQVTRRLNPSVRVERTARGGEVTLPPTGVSLLEISFASVFPEPELQGAAGRWRGGSQAESLRQDLLFPNAPDSINDIRNPEVRNGYLMPTWAHQPTNRYQYIPPNQLASMMKNIADQGVVFQLIISSTGPTGEPVGAEIFANMNAVIRSWTDWEDEGDSRWYNVTFLQYRPVVIRKVKKVPAKKKPKKSRPQRSGSKPTPATVPVSRLGSVGPDQIPRA